LPDDLGTRQGADSFNEPGTMIDTPIDERRQTVAPELAQRRVDREAA
jgi:hypothetical protein